MEFNNLPKDIIFDIFSRIPLKPLYKLLIVCKKWQLLLELNPEFREFYHQKHKINPILVFKQQKTDNSTTQLSSYSIDFTQFHQINPINPIYQNPINFQQPLTSILSSNGILCLISKSQALLYDPVITRLTNLPNSSHFGSSLNFAFGFSTCRKEFKLIHFYTIENFDNYHYCQVKEVMCEIISFPSSNLGSMMISSSIDWRFLGKSPFDVLGRKDYVFIDGKFYWLIVERKFNPDCVKIMCFDVEIEVFGLVCFPRSYSNRSVECLDLVQIMGKLCLTDRLPWDSTMNVWMLMKEEEGFSNYWENKYKIDLMGVLHHDVRILGHFTKISTSRSSNSSRSNGNGSSDSETDGEILMKIGDQCFGLYELQSQLFKELGDGIVEQIEGWNLELMIDRKLML